MPEPEHPENHARSERAFHPATRHVVDEKPANTINPTIEVAITGQPQFHVLILTMLERESQLPRSGPDVPVFRLASPASTTCGYIQKRGHHAEAHVTLRDVEQRAARYAAIIDGQSFQRFGSPAELKKSDPTSSRKADAYSL